MRLGSTLPLADLRTGHLTPRGLAHNARTLEELGYESIWTFDAVGRGFMLPDPLMALTVVATATELVEFGTGVLQLAIRNTAEVAHRALTLHQLAGGRFLFGVGPGSTRADFDVFAKAYEDRFERFELQLAELREWLGDGAVGGRSLSPWRAARGGPSIVLAGWRGRWIERAAAEAQGWIASAANTDDAALADAIERFRAAGGKRAIVTNVQVGNDLGRAVDRLQHLADLGFDDAVVLDQSPSLDRLAKLRDSVAS
jgi:alkanesulfonate monooxygenase SsuD/methylene tetrahydromethanopterin reductase-like flavin-dependent oxidoreductase (luciferase family)